MTETASRAGARRIDGVSQAVGFFTGASLLIDEDLCVNLRGRVQICTQCADTCPAEALTISTDAIDVDEQGCTGCGACLPACSAGVHSLTGFVPRRFLGALRGAEAVHLHCSASRDRGGGVVIPCHRVLDPRLLAAAAADGVSIIQLHGLDHCGRCEKGSALEFLGHSRRQLADWLGDAAPEVVQARDSEPAGHRVYEDQPHLSRRAFLRFAGAQTAVTAAEWIVPVAETGDAEAESLPFFQGGGERQRSVVYQAMLAERADALEWQDGAVLPWRGRSFNDACTACLACGERCPTGALQSLENESARQVSFEQALCTDCGLCERVCPQHAVVTRAVTDVSEVKAPRHVLVHRVQSLCTHCGHAFLPETPGESCCPVCRNEQQLDDEWMAMLGG